MNTAPRIVRPRELGNDALVALAAVARGVGAATHAQRRQMEGVLAKEDLSPVTVADYSVQAIVASTLARSFPHDPLVAEEDFSRLEAGNAGDVVARVVDNVCSMDSSITPTDVRRLIDRGTGEPVGRFWTLDPIDGTKGLIRGGQYVIALALISDGAVQVGVIGCPRLSLGAAPGTTSAGGSGGLAVAVRGRGAWWAPATDGTLLRLSVSSVRDAHRARVLRSFESGHIDAARFDRALTTLGTRESAVGIDSQAKHVVLASGGADALLRYPPQAGTHDAIWDQAAGSLLVEEAGGRVTDLAGRPLDLSTGRRLLRNYGVIASNGLLHDALLAAVHATEQTIPRS